MDAEPGDDTDLRVAPLAPDTLERQVFEARLAARLLGGQPALPRIDRFVLERMLGAGGMGTVWLAHDEVLDRRVALKLVRRGDAVAGERMRLREARGLARIAHPNVIGVHDVGEHEGRVWLAMEYLPGRTLRECAGELGRDEVLSHWIAAGRGLAAIHTAGLVHRDIKPDNVLLGDDGCVRVIDLGLVREAAARAHGLVKTRGFVGTRAYAAPEQLRGEPVDARADQYAYSVSILESLGAARPPPGDPREPLPAALLAVLARARHPDPAQRFASVTECIDALADAARSASLRPTVDAGRARAQPLAEVVDAPTSALPLRFTATPVSTVGGSPPTSDAAGEPPMTPWIGHYEVIGELGRGGMGVVYAAYDARLDRKVAVKRLLGGRREPRSRLHREALALAKLSHPNVIPIYEIVESADSTFIVMELVEGQTLRQWQTTARAPGDVLAVFKAAARGLIAAHQKHLIHRDFKPDNVMLGDDGRVRVMDFGLASVSSQAVTRPPSGGGVMSSRPSFDLSHPGTMVGTPAYMSPEQMRAEPASVASDVFSFCVALYEALHGERPFAGRTFEELKESVTRGEIRAAPAGSNVPGWLRALVCRGLAVKPEDRHESMQALLDAIVEGELAEQGDPREPPAYVFVAHASRDKQAVLRLCEHLLAHGVRPWLDVWELTPGADGRAATEQALRAAPAVIVCGDPEDAETLAARIERDPKTVYGVRLPGAGAVALGARHAAVEFDENRWEDGVFELARLIGVDRRSDRWLADEAARAGVAAEELSPYRGLAAFREQDARWMFGRDDEVAALLELIRSGQTRFLTLIGASGSGKSSLLMGGVCPMLRSGALGDGSAWSVACLRPGPRPCEALAHALVHLDARGDATADGSTIARLRAELQRDSDTLRTTLGARGPGRTLLVIDQLEELFTEAGFGGHADGGEALAFVRNLLAATEELAGRDGNVWIAATLRADFVQRGLEVPELARALQVGTYFALPPMTEAQIRAAIERPATRVGYRVERRVVDKLVGAAAQAGRLPLLQHVLRELWARRDEARRTLTDAAYAETGGLEGAIAAAAERALAGLRERLGAEGEVVTRRLMTRLVNLGDRSSEDTRRRVTLAALGDDAATRRVLEALVREARVLVATEVEGVETVEIAHEALLREWTTLVRWLDADRGALKLRQELAQDAGRGSSGEYLWGPGRVEEAQRVLDASTVELDAVERGFLAASERSVRRRRRWVQAGIATLLAASVVTVAVVNAQRAEAVRERHEADKARESAEAAQTKAEAAEAEALAARTQAERDRAQAEHERTRAETSQKENERSVKQMFEVALRPLTERLVAQRQDVGVVEVDHRWTPLLARGERTLVAASLGESFRAVVAGHDSVLTDADADGRSIFLEITTQWLLADQARRAVAIVTRPDERDRRFVALERHLLRLSHDVIRLTSLARDQALADVGMVILDGRGLPVLSEGEVAAIEAFVRRGGGVLAVGRGRAWLDGKNVAAPTLDDFPVNAALAAFGARWSDADVGPRELAQWDVAAIVHFKNKLADEVNLYTRSAGRDELYTTLAAGEARDLLTVVGRTWVFRATADGKELGNVVIEDEEQTVGIAATVDRTRDRPRPKPVPAPLPDDSGGKELHLRERLSDADLQVGLGEAAQAAKACGKQLQTLMSEAVVEVTVGGDGKVEAIVVRPPAKGTPEATCIATAVKQQTFPRSREGGTATWRLKLY